MRFFKSANASRSVLSLILTSDHIELAILLKTTEGAPRIIFAASKPIEMTAGEKPLLTRLTSGLTALADEVVREGLPHIVSRKIAEGHFDTIEVFYGAPWYVSRGRHVTINQAESSSITSALLEQLMTQHMEGLLPPEMKNVVVLEQHSHGFTINGYPVENPVGKEGAAIGMHIFVSAIDAATQSAVETILHQFFHTHAINHHSVLLPLTRVLRQTNIAEEVYFLVEVSGYMTEVSAIDRGMVVDTVSFPEGFETLLQNTAGALKRRPEEVKALAKRPGDFGLTPEFRVAHEEMLTSWSRGYATALQSLGATGVPRGTVLIAETNSREAFKREITRLSGSSVLALSKDSYESIYDPSARSNTHILSALLAQSI